MSGSTNHLPSGWAETTLADFTAPTRPRVSPSNHPKAPFIGMEHVQAHSMKLLGTVPSETMKSSSVRFEGGDVLYGRLRPYLNKVTRPDFCGLCSAEFIVFPKQENLSNRFLMYRLNAWDFVRFTSSLNTGDRPRVDFGQIGIFPISLPPLEEQCRIVAEIEKQFSRLDAGVAALRRVEANLKRYKASVLRAACEGKLTEAWRAENADVKPASQLLQRILTERRRRWEEAELAKMVAKGKHPQSDKWKEKYKEPVAPNADELPALPETWCWATVSQVSELIQYGSSAKCSTDVKGVPVLRMGNISTDGQIELSKLKYLSPDHDEFPALFLQQADLLFNRTNSAELVGKSAVFVGDPKPCSFASYLIRVRCIEGAKSTFVASCLNSALGRAWIRSVVSQQVGQANVNGTKLAGFTFPLPPADEQAEIVQHLDAALTVFQKTEAAIATGDRRSNRLRQSILKDAFEGKLVKQDPTDEPASVLLERIRESPGASETRRRIAMPRTKRKSVRSGR